MFCLESFLLITQKRKEIDDQLSQYKEEMPLLKRLNEEYVKKLQYFESKCSTFYIGNEKEFLLKKKQVFSDYKSNIIDKKSNSNNVAIFWIDVDNMKQLNTNYGHINTNEILKIFERQIILYCKN